jgi:hypothetical protein
MGNMGEMVRTVVGLLEPTHRVGKGPMHPRMHFTSRNRATVPPWAVTANLPTRKADAPCRVGDTGPLIRLSFFAPGSWFKRTTSGATLTNSSFSLPFKISCRDLEALIRGKPPDPLPVARINGGPADAQPEPFADQDQVHPGEARATLAATQFDVRSETDDYPTKAYLVS